MRSRIKHHIRNGMYCRQVDGENSRGTILYIHGLGESGLCFEKLILDARLEAWTHLVPDLPGYGKSPWPDPPLGLEAQAENLAEWLKMCSIDGVTVFGHSMGGVAGLFFCEKFAPLVDGFLNVEGNISYHDCSFSSRVAEFSIEKILEEGLEELLSFVYQGGVDDPVLRDYFASMRVCNPRAYHLNSKELVEAAKREDLAGRMAALPMPCRYILGRPRGTGEHSQELLTQAGVGWRTVENAGHWPFLDDQDIFVNEMVDALCDFSSP